MQATVSDADFIEMFERLGAAKVAKKLGLNVRNVHTRRRNLEKKLHRPLVTPNQHLDQPQARQYPHRIELTVDNGIVIIGSDFHYWPESISTAHRALVKLCKQLSPKVVILNGDVIDGCTISRHPPIGWEHRPSLIREIEAAQDRLEEIEAAVDGRKVRAANNDDDGEPRYRRLNRRSSTRLCWSLGNHDMRYGTRLASVAPEYAKVHGVHLKDHFPMWEPCWSVHVNPRTDGWTEIKHRWKGGTHAAFNNARESAVHFATGHDHQLGTAVFTNRRGTIFGVDTGTAADVEGPQFVDYTEDNPKNWRQGLQVLTYWRGLLLWPETVWVMDEQKGLVCFRGEVFKV